MCYNINSSRIIAEKWNNHLLVYIYDEEGYDVFSEKIIEAINNGEAKVIKWDSNVN